MIEKNNLLLLNDTIYKIYTIENFDKMRISVLKSLQILIPYTIASFYLASEFGQEKLDNPVGIGLTEEQLQDYLNVFEDLDYTRWLFSCPYSKAYRDTDLISDESRINTQYYKEMYAPAGIHFSAVLSIVHNGTFFGVVTLYRKIGDLDFSDDEMLILDLLKDHLGFRLYNSTLKVNLKGQSLTTEEFIEKYHLTLREIEIVKLMLDGMSNNEICSKLCISPNTLKKHTLNIYKKLGISSWRDLIKLF